MGLPNTAIVQRLMWRYAICIFSRCHTVTSPSQAVRDALIAHGLRSELVLVSNGLRSVPLRPHEAIRRLRATHHLQGPTFVYVGRLSPEKSLDVLIHAFHHVVAQLPEARLVLIGTGPYRPRLQRLISQLGLASQVVQLGYVPHHELLAANLPRLGDVFVTASKTENQPLSIMEALAFGLPVVGVRARGMPELVTDGENGLLCQPDDSVAMAHCMLRLVNDASLRFHMSQAARASVTNHTITRTVNTLEHLYRLAIWRVKHRLLMGVAAPGKSETL